MGANDQSDSGRLPGFGSGAEQPGAPASAPPPVHQPERQGTRTAGRRTGTGRDEQERDEQEQGTREQQAKRQQAPQPPRRRRRVAVAVVVVLALVAAGVGAAFGVPQIGVALGLRPGPRELATQVGTGFLADWQAGNYAGMQARVFDPKDDMSRVYGGMVQRLQVTKVSVRPGALDESGTTLPYTATATLQDLGDVSWSSVVHLVELPVGWRVRFTADTVYPGLSNGQRLELEKTPAERGRVVDRNGGPAVRRPRPVGQRARPLRRDGGGREGGRREGGGRDRPGTHLRPPVGRPAGHSAADRRRRPQAGRAGAAGVGVTARDARQDDVRPATCSRPPSRRSPG